MPRPRGRPPLWPRVFYVLCWKCRAKIYLETEQGNRFKADPLTCPSCGALFILKPGRRVKIEKLP